jgi:hypothetical protein
MFLLDDVIEFHSEHKIIQIRVHVLHILCTFRFSTYDATKWSTLPLISKWIRNTHIQSYTSHSRRLSAESSKLHKEIVYFLSMKHTRRALTRTLLVIIGCPFLHHCRDPVYYRPCVNCSAWDTSPDFRANQQNTARSRYADKDMHTQPIVIHFVFQESDCSYYTNEHLILKRLYSRPHA